MPEYDCKWDLHVNAFHADYNCAEVEKFPTIIVLKISRDYLKKH